ncbi:shikimate kinase [Anaerosporobacter faecicola]|uniref:shikimate kinase n=1 Tax=Anaerosporobacter faecicola TaxID=2718714 RepID=UPI001EE5D22E|nr:shikimate kinase [Anaerosporobacter faecicola]
MKAEQIKEVFHKNIMLIGFMGTGKSTISSYLSKWLGLEEVDLDAKIVEKAGMSIPKIFEQYGEVYFRNLETEVLKEVQQREQLIVSCGGGIVLRDENVAQMKAHGKIVLLTATPETVYERVKDSKNRPILNGHMNVEYIAQLMEKRRERYEQCADLVVATDGKTVEQIGEEMMMQLLA